MSSEIQRLADTPGILAVAVHRGDVVEMHAESPAEAEKWRGLVTAAQPVLAVSREQEMRISFDKCTVVVVSAANLTFSIVVQKPHDVIKSLKRMVRRLVKNAGKIAAAGSARKSFVIPPPPVFGQEESSE